MSLAPDTPDFTPFRTFQVFGYLIGGIGPLLLHCFTSVTGIERSLFHADHVAFFFACAILGSVLGLLVLVVDKSYHQSKLFKGLFALEATFSFFLIHVLVLATGGAKSSVFALSYMYLPAVVGYTYGAGMNLLGAAFFSLGSYVLNLYALDDQLPMLDSLIKLGPTFSNATPADGDYSYLIVFGAQLFVTAYIGWRRRSNDTP